MEQKPLRTFRNVHEHPHITGGEKYTKPSMTVPDMSMSVSEILYRYTHGQPLTKSSHMVYGGDDWLPSSNMEFDERHELLLQNIERVNALQKEVAEKKKTRQETRKQQIADKKAKEEAIEKYLAEKAKNSTV